MMIRRIDDQPHDGDFAFNERESDPSRWYDPTTGRYLSVEPIGYANADPLNLYRYVSNAAPNRIDPTQPSNTSTSLAIEATDEGR